MVKAQDCYWIDMTDLNKWHNLKGCKGIVSSELYWKRNGVETFRTPYTFCLTGQVPSITFFYRYKNKNSQRVELVKTTPNYGGIRWWFICPITGNKCRKLYMIRHNVGFVSRKAYINFYYQSQLEKGLARAMGRRDKVAYKYRAENLANYFPKPKGMHTKTYKCAIKKLTNLEKKVEELFKARFGWY